jgi:predicted nucleotidyltransferase
MTAIEPALRAITELIVRACDPEEVVLFGSWAKGTADVASDVDLVVIGDFAASWWLRERELRDELSAFPISVDLHLLTRGELAVEAARPRTYLNTLRQTSRCLYRRDPDARAALLPTLGQRGTMAALGST